MADDQQHANQKPAGSMNASRKISLTPGGTVEAITGHAASRSFAGIRA